MKYWDVKTAPRTEQEAYERWKNRLQSELSTLPYAKRLKIEVQTGPFRLSDYTSGNHYVDEDGCAISRAEAQAELDYLNGSV